MHVNARKSLRMFSVVLLVAAGIGLSKSPAKTAVVPSPSEGGALAAAPSPVSVPSPSEAPVASPPTVDDSAKSAASVHTDSIAAPASAKMDSAISPAIAGVDSSASSVAKPSVDSSARAQSAPKAADSTRMRVEAPKPRTKKVVNIAVSDLVGKGVTQPEADLITEQVRASLLGTGSFKVMERSMMDQIMKEQGFQQSGSCDNSECMVSVGRILGVQNLVVGSVGQVGHIFMINVKLVDVGTGEVLNSMTETCECTIEQLLKATPGKVAASLDYEVRKSVAGTMQISSQPAGATVFLDNREVGATPFKSSLLDPGGYSLALVMPDWKRIDRIVQVETGRELALNLTMERSDEWIASQKAAEERARQAELAKQAEIKRQAEAAHQQKRLMWRIGLSAVSALCVGGGYYFQTLADGNQSSSDKAYERYLQTQDPALMASAKSDIENYDISADRNRNLRNISYGLGLAALSSISFTFFF